MFYSRGHAGNGGLGSSGNAATTGSFSNAETIKLSLDDCCSDCGRLRGQLAWSGAANLTATMHAAW